MKKLLSIFLLVTLMAGLMATMAFADSTAITVSGGTAKVGENIDVVVSIVNNPGFRSGKVTLTYDASKLEYVSTTMGSFAGVINDPLTGTVTAGTVIVNHASATAVAGDGALFTVTFKVLAKEGTAAVTAELTGMRDADGNAVSVASNTVSGSVTVKADEPAHTCDAGKWVNTDPDDHWKVCTDANCGKEIDGTRAPHSWGEGVVTTQPTTEADGVKTFTCECGATKTESIDKLESAHTCDAGKWVNTDPDDHWKVCTDANCGKEIAGTRAAHSYGEYVANADDLTETGTCECGRTDTRDIEGGAGGGDEVDPDQGGEGGEGGDTPAQPTTPVTPSDPTESPKTGNGALVAMSIAVLVLAAAAVVIVTGKKKA